jgi:6-phosphogluconolactonase
MNKLLRRYVGIVMLTALPWLPAFAAFPIVKLYTMSNASNGNEVLVYDRLSDGSLSKVANVSTSGTGTGAGLGNQSALSLSKDGNFLFAVNAASNSVSSFRITPNGLDLMSTLSSNGINPVSVSEDHGRLFVLNTGDTSNPGNIFGFRVTRDGRLRPMYNSKRLLSSRSASTGAAQISFSNDGRQLIVTEKATNQILTYRMDEDGVPGKTVINASSGNTPFGFAVGKRDQIFVSNAEGGAANLTSLSSYQLLPQGKLNAISPQVTTGETAACWVALTPDGRYAFTTNTGSGSISSFQIGLDGKAAVAENKAGNTGTGSAPIDMIVGPESRFLYTLNSNTHSISSFEVDLDGTLTSVTTQDNLPNGTNGLIAQ